MEEQIKIKVTVPKIFFWDHADRGCVEHSGERNEFLVSENKLKVTVLLDRRDIDDLMSDAEYYGSKVGSDRSFDPSICSSATSTVKALMRQGFDRRHPTWKIR